MDPTLRGTPHAPARLGGSHLPHGRAPGGAAPLPVWARARVGGAPAHPPVWAIVPLGRDGWAHGTAPFSGASAFRALART
ncbi:hypothetical protein ABZ926_37095, partial [Streptomyces litmocidini]